MATEPLAAVTDLSARKINVTDVETVNALLASASSAVQDAAGGLIGPLVGKTIAVPGGCHEWLDFPLVITEVLSVTLDEQPVTGWKLRSGRLWRGDGWPERHGLDYAVTGNFGLAEIPADIVDLVCSLVAAGLAAIDEGYDPKRGVMSTAIDDYRESYAKGDDEIINPMELPQRTRDWLRARFGTTAHVIGTRR